MPEKTILLIEDSSDDIELTLRALAKNRIMNKVTVVRDGAEALDYVFAAAPTPDEIPPRARRSRCLTSNCRRSAGWRSCDRFERIPRPNCIRWSS